MQSTAACQPREGTVSGGAGARIGDGTGALGSGTAGGRAPIMAKRQSLGLSIATGSGLNSFNTPSNAGCPLVVPSMNSANPLKSANHHQAPTVARVPFDAYLQHQRQLKRQFASMSTPASPRIVSLQQPNTPTGASNPLLSPFPFNLHQNFNASFLIPSTPGAPASAYPLPLPSPVVAPTKPLETAPHSNLYLANVSASHSPATADSYVSAPSSTAGMENAHLLDDFKFPDHDGQAKSAIPETKNDGASLAKLLFELDDMSFLSPHPFMQHSFSQFPHALSQGLPSTGNSQLLLHRTSNSNSHTPILSFASSSTSSPEQPHLTRQHNSPFDSADSLFAAQSSTRTTTSGALSPRVASSPASFSSLPQQAVRSPPLSMELATIHESLGFLDVPIPTVAFTALSSNMDALTHTLPKQAAQMVALHHGPQQNKRDMDCDGDEMDMPDDENDGDYMEHPPLSPSPSPQSKHDSAWSPQPSAASKPRIRKVKKSSISSTTNSAVTSHSDDSRPRDYRCELCKNRFLRRQDLSRHLVTHSKSKTHNCPLGCGTSFGRSDALTRHVKAKRCSGALSVAI